MLVCVYGYSRVMIKENTMQKAKMSVLLPLVKGENKGG